MADVVGVADLVDVADAVGSADVVDAVGSGCCGRCGRGSDIGEVKGSLQAGKEHRSYCSHIVT